jgi:hypothetical protein
MITMLCGENIIPYTVLRIRRVATATASICRAGSVDTTRKRIGISANPGDSGGSAKDRFLSDGSTRDYTTAPRDRANRFKP